MISRILIANRGEIALRILRTCRQMDIDTVAVYSKADAGAAWLEFANESICIGPASAAESYLDVARIMAAAEVASVEAIHPGYGFLAERAEFAQVCERSNIKFIGPSSQAIALMGDKAAAKRLAREQGVPVVPGSDGVIDSPDEALALARTLGYPVLLKAVYGGGGRGMRLAHNDMSLRANFAAARAEAQAAFKDGSLYLEKYLDKPRHVEIQVLADQCGGAVHLGERDCTIQRRHQKLIEEAPCPVLDEDLRRRMGEAALTLVRAAKYTNAGTMEFLLDRDRNFYFIECNARLQVEHPVTEAVTGLDLVREQILIAAGRKLAFAQEDVRFTGHAIECRINAEDPFQDFAPSPGVITHYFPPGGAGVRMDSHIYTGYRVPSQYDSLLGKLIVHAADRPAAIALMECALDEIRVAGIATTIPLYRDIFRHTKFATGDVDVRFIDEYFVGMRTPPRGEV